MHRRRALRKSPPVTKFLTLASFAMLAGNLWILARSLLHRSPSYPQQAVGTTDELVVGSVKMFSYPTFQDPCILVRTSADTYAAYSQKCTHLSCAVYYAKEQSRLECPCHQGFFSIADGLALREPPQRALPRVVLEMNGGQLVVVRIVGEGA